MIFLLKKCLVFLACLALLTACGRSEIVGSPWDNAQIPVVYSVISPNEPVQVYLSKTYNSNFPVEKNPYPEAKVYLCGPDSNWVELTHLTADTTVFADTKNLLTVEKGKTYSLKVELNNTTIHAQTSVPAIPAIINEATCIYVKMAAHYSASVLINGKYVDANLNFLKVNFTLPANTDYGYFLTAFSEQPLGVTAITGNSYQNKDFFCPVDSTSFLLKLVTLDPFLNKYNEAESINFFQQDQEQSIVLALTQTFGGVIPQFSNIANGVGLFGSYVTDSKRVEITIPAE